MSKKETKESAKKRAKNRKWRRIIVVGFFLLLAFYVVFATFNGGLQEYTERLFHCAQVEETR